MRFEERGRHGARGAVALSLGLVVLGWTPLPAAAGKSVELVLDVPVGKTLHYHVSQDAEGTYNGIPFSSMLSSEIDVHRLEGSSDNLRFRVVTVKVEASQRLGSEVRPQDLGLDGMISEVEVTRSGRLVQFDPPTGATSDQRKQLERLADGVFVELPTEPVAPDDTWELDLSKPAEGIEATGEYVLESVDTKKQPGVAKISGEMKMESAEPEVVGKGRARAEVAIPGGYLLASKGSMDVEPKEGPALTQTFEIRLAP